MVLHSVSASSTRCALLAILVTLALSLNVGAEESLPYDIQSGRVDNSTFLGWRLFHSTCHGCHGVDATGTTIAPSLVERIERLSARDFTIKVLSRYRITVSAQAASSDDKSELREEILQQVMRRERGEVSMPAWELDPNIKPHVLDLYAYLRARADGALAPGRPERQSEGR
jgi:hypothetical protein